MFTGIIQELGTVSRIERTKGLVRLSIVAPKLAARLEHGESVSVNGACLSIVQIRQQALSFELIPETQHLTTLNALRSGDRVNLEPSLSLADRLNGHILLGHVDGTGTIIARHQMAGELTLTLRIGKALRRFLVPKGPVTVDGVSLTVGSTPSASTMTIHLIPETLRATTLGTRGVGDRVNVELDYVAKLIWQFLHAR